MTVINFGPFKCYEDLKDPVEEDGGTNTFKFDIREAGCNFAFPKVTIVNIEKV